MTTKTATIPTADLYSNLPEHIVVEFLQDDEVSLEGISVARARYNQAAAWRLWSRCRSPFAMHLVRGLS